MRILGFILVLGLIGCGGNAGSDPTVDPQQGGGMSGSAGSAGAAGSAGSSGSAGTSGSAPFACGGSITLRMVPSSAGSPWRACSYGRQNGCGGSGWIEIFDAAGQPVWMTLNCSQVECSACSDQFGARGCTGTCGLASILPLEGIEMMWDGVRFTNGLCSSGAQCGTPACAEPGSYVARFCGEPDSAQSGPGECDRDPTICVDVPFELPGAGVVEAVLTAP